MVWLKFALCLAIILFAGTKLARYGDAIAEKTGVGRIWIGLVLLAAITSVPELVTGVSSATLVKEQDLAVGTLFGSCCFNLAIIALLDILHRRTPVLSEVSRQHIACAGAVILFIAIAGSSIFAGERLSGLTLGWVGVSSIIIFILYLVTIWGTFRFSQGHQSPSLEAAPLQYQGIPTRIVYLKFALAAVAVIGTGIWVSFIGNEIALTYNWSTSFVGSLFLAISTSMPELVVSIAAFRLGALDMAIADILGSNMFNIAIIFPVDIFYTQGPILSSASGIHLTTAIAAIAMSLLVIIGLRFRQQRKTFIVTSWYSPVLIALYIAGAYALFKGISPG